MTASDHKGSPESTVRTLPTPLSRSQTSRSEKVERAAETADPHVDLEDAAAGGVEDEDERHEKLHEAEHTKTWEMDLANPRNWAKSKKWRMTAIVSFYTFVSPLASSMMAPALADIASAYGITNSSIVALTLSIFLLAYALGPLVLAPLSEMYGRAWVLHISNLVFVAFTCACAVAPDTATLIVFRFLSGLAGSAPLSIGAGCISDMFREDERGGAMGVYTLGPLIGPVVGPVAGGFIAQGLGYHWVFWTIAIIAATASLVGIPFMRESYAPVLIARLMKMKGIAPPRISLREHLWTNLSRPVVLLTRSFICFVLSLYMAVIYGIMYLMFVTFPSLFSNTYGWSPGVDGLAYLGIGIGFLVGTLIGAKLVDKIYVTRKLKSGGVGKPEDRIPVMFAGSLLGPVGLLWYGWSADEGVHWIVPLIGSGVFGCAMMLCFLPLQVYLVDSFRYAASAVAAATLLRSVFGFAFPLFASRIFTTLGVGGGYSLVAGICVVVGWPFPLYIYLHGERLRAKSQYTR